MTNPFVSVIIPTFNRKEFCKKAVDSVINQTYKNYELIVVDDCSSDGTSAEYLFGKEQKHIYIRQKYNCGVSKSRNTGVSHSKAEWIAFLDSDDEWYPDKLEKQVTWLSNNPSYNIVQTKEIWIRRGVRVNPPKTHEKIGGFIFKESLKRCMITPSSVMLRKKLFTEAGKFNESIPACEDYGLWVRITLNHPVGLIDEYLLTRNGGRKDQLSLSVEVLDKFRVRTLLDLLTWGKLTIEQKSLVCKTLVKKAEIVANGLKKRNKADEYERFRRIADRYRKYF